ncbi:MAG: beta-ketoacyl synthase N-terminal-like domain-containing protein [Planctomycetota bacterium]|jgi:hypothetical protein|nr:beta-ketoacyl synthase N-terminal-like domain-containing protein [Planctomycetota bacterium]
MTASGHRYHQVYIHHWDALCAAGDAVSTWDAWCHGRVCLEQDEAYGWVGRAPVTTTEQRLLALMRHAAAKPIEHLTSSEPFLALAASKGDTGTLLRALAPEDLLPALPGGLNAAIARDQGWSGYREAAPVAACSTGLYALLAAADALEWGHAKEALAGTADASLQALLLAGFDRLGVITRHQPSAFTGAGTGFAPGEGAAAFALATTPGPWQLLGGIRCGDASHPTRCQDPAVLLHCLSTLWDLCPKPDLIVAHATGTKVGDAYECAGLDAGPWRTAERMVLKPLIGHCLGASSSVELAAALHAPQRRIWKLGLGFGGHMAALAIQATDN